MRDFISKASEIFVSSGRPEPHKEIRLLTEARQFYYGYLLFSLVSLLLEHFYGL